LVSFEKFWKKEISQYAAFAYYSRPFDSFSQDNAAQGETSFFVAYYGLSPAATVNSVIARFFLTCGNVCATRGELYLPCRAAGFRPRRLYSVDNVHSKNYSFLYYPL
jgi:hypothetical protein